MEEARGELLHLPHHRERPHLRSVEHLTPPEEAGQETLRELFDQMVDLATMPTQFADRLVVEAELQGENLEREVITFQLSQRQNNGLAFFECVDSAMLVRQEGVVIVVEYSRIYYHGQWRPVRKLDELQYNWTQDYQDGSFGMVDAVLTEDAASLHHEAAKQEIDSRAKEQRMRYMMGTVAITRSVS